jgi:hypothetical protein
LFDSSPPPRRLEVRRDLERVLGLRVLGLRVVGLIVVGLLDGRRVGMEMAVLLCVSLRRSPSTAVPNNRPMTTTAWIKKLVMIGLIDYGMW